MDYVALSFYALVCGTLGFIAPRFGRPLARFGLGAVIGILAALFLPSLKGFLGM